MGRRIGSVLPLILLLGSGPGRAAETGDFDGDGRLSITDPIFLLGSLFPGIGKIPEPNPLCGTDTSPDGIGCGVDPGCQQEKGSP